MSSRGIFAFVCGCQLLLSASEAGAKVAATSFARLAESSDLIVLAKVDSVTGKPSDPGRRAEATVTEVWKGPEVATVEFHAYRTWTCDISDAKPGETVLLFLSKEKEKGDGWVINAAGRGRMPLRTVDGKTYVTPFADVILPPGTPAIAAPAGGYGRSVGLDAARDLVKAAIRAGK